MIDDASITAANPWWTSPAWEQSDPHLRRLRVLPMLLPAPFVDAVDLDRPGIHVLRGPRQVGKSTALKLLARRAMGDSVEPRRVVYLALDLLEGQPVREFAATVRRALELAAAPALPRLVLLDEVTACPGWQTAVKALWDAGTIDTDVVVCTGSSATDLATGTADRLPGRRNAGSDHLALPVDFGTFARAVDPGLPPPPAWSLRELAEADIAGLKAHLPRLDSALERYLAFGGLPAAVAEAIGGAPSPSDQTKRVLEDSILREVLRRGVSVPAIWALFERVARSLSSPVSWEHLARDMQMPLGLRAKKPPAGPVVRDYLEFLASAYLVAIVHAWKSSGGSNDLARAKKLYLFDPLLHAVILDHAPGLRRDVPALVENAVAIALLRRYEPAAQRLAGFADLADVHTWVTANGGEVDFVAGPRSALDICEVKYRQRVDRREVASIPRAFPGRPVCVATRHESGVGTSGYHMFPASLLLWALSG